MDINENQNKLAGITDRSYDVIVVGAGPAGCSAAYFLHEYGFKVLLLEKHTMPREKICGDGFGPKAMEHFQKMGVLHKIEDANPFRVSRVILSSPNTNMMSGKVPKIDGYEDYITVFPRKKLDDILFNHIDELPNIKTLQNFRVTDVIRDAKRIVGIKGKIDNETYQIRGTYIIGADGPNSVIARKISLLNNDRKHLAFAARAYFEGVEGIQDAIELHYEKKIMPGYGWVFPTGETTANIGAGIFRRFENGETRSLKSLFYQFISENERVKHMLRNARMTGELRAAPLTIISSPLKRSKDNVVLVGDAGSFVDLLTGEGIYYALKTGELAARAIHESSRKGVTPDKGFEKYIRKEFYFRELIPSKVLQPALLNESIVNLMVGLGSRSESIAANVAGVISHVIPKYRLMTKF